MSSEIWAEDRVFANELAAGAVFIHPFEDVLLNFRGAMMIGRELLLRVTKVFDGAVVTELVVPVALWRGGSWMGSTEQKPQLVDHFNCNFPALVVESPESVDQHVQRLLGGRKIVIGGMRIVDQEVAGPPPAEEGARDWMISVAWSRFPSELGLDSVEGERSHFMMIDRDFGVCVRIGPQMNGMSDRFPVTVRMGIAHRAVNELLARLEGREVKPWTWTVAHEQRFFNPDAPWAYSGRGDADEVLADVAVSLERAREWANDQLVNRFLDTADSPVLSALYERTRIADAIHRGDLDEARSRFQLWQQDTVRANSPVIHANPAAEFGRNVAALLADT